MGDGDSLRVLFVGEYGEEMEQRRCAEMLLGADRGRRNGACARAQGILGAVAAGRSWSSAAKEGGARLTAGQHQWRRSPCAQRWLSRRWSLASCCRRTGEGLQLLVPLGGGAGALGADHGREGAPAGNPAHAEKAATKGRAGGAGR